MNCSKCNSAAVLNTVLGKDFYYCRNCKDEVGLTPAADPEKQFHSFAVEPPIRSGVIQPGIYQVEFCSYYIKTTQISAPHYAYDDWIEVRCTCYLEGTAMDDLRVIPIFSSPTAPKQQVLAGNSFVGGVAGTSPTQQPGQAGNNMGGLGKYSISYPIDLQYGVGIVDALQELYESK